MTDFRRLATLCLVAAPATLIAACDDPSPTGLAAAATGPQTMTMAMDGAVTVPFEARFFTDLAELRPDPSCGAPPRLLNVQVGSGEATHLGRFSVRITFCIDATDILDDGQLTEGESAPYDGGLGTLTAADGSELGIAIAGAVLPSPHPDFDLEFSDPFQVTGGTGRLGGATGSGFTTSFVDLQSVPSRTTHLWSGTLTLQRPGGL